MFANEKQLKTFVELFRDGTKLTYSKNEYIIRPGESPSGIFYIESGFVKAFNISKYGEENLLIIRKEHEVFPLIWAIIGEERDIVYQALAPTTVWRVSSEDFTNFMTSHPDALPPLLDMVTEMYRRHSERILNLEYRSVRERLVSFLLLMAKRFGEKSKDGIKIAIPLRHQDVASSINASRETASRELSFLERKNLISNSSSYITLKDKKALEAFL
jgi:CRP/FNR family transcriptional regulator